MYEFYGDYWHGNPEVFDQEGINSVAKKSFGFLYERTKTKDALIISSGYKLITIWENDFEKSRRNKD